MRKVPNSQPLGFQIHFEVTEMKDALPGLIEKRFPVGHFHHVRRVPLKFSRGCTDRYEIARLPVFGVPPPPEEEVTRREVRALLEEEIRKLNSPESIVMALLLEGIPARELAHSLKLTPREVHNIKRRAFTHLRRSPLLKSLLTRH